MQLQIGHGSVRNILSVVGFTDYGRQGRNGRHGELTELAVSSIDVGEGKGVTGGSGAVEEQCNETKARRAGKRMTVVSRMQTAGLGGARRW